jgi:phosphoserine phosphatase
MYTLVLTAPLGRLTHDAAQSVASAIGRPLHWLEPGTAAEVPVDDPHAARAAARAALNGHSVDANVVHTSTRRKRILIADMDSTIIGCECIDEIADMAGLKPQIAAITERAMRGELDFETALRERVGLLKGLPESALERTYAERVRLNPGARATVETMKANGAVTALVSGGFTFFTERVGEAAGFQTHRANELLIENGALTGKVAEPILGREAKLEQLERICQFHALSLDDAIAVGDGANDSAMIKAAGIGVAYRAKPVLKSVASAHLDYSDLTALLYLQGYKSDEIVTS